MVSKSGKACTRRRASPEGVSRVVARDASMGQTQAEAANHIVAGEGLVVGAYKERLERVKLPTSDAEVKKIPQCGKGARGVRCGRDGKRNAMTEGVRFGGWQGQQ
jgi:hypothetical protein